MARGGYDTVARVCGQRWPRLMPVTWAAAYCGMNVARFRAIPETKDMAATIGGEEMYDRRKIDEFIDNIDHKE